jgi:isoquinoline 1-oxidoreductase subunit alpha
MAMSIETKVNGAKVTIDVDGDMPLLWALRENLQLTGTKFGCGIGTCGSCSVHVDGSLMRSCTVPVSFVAGKTVTTIEGMAKTDGTLSALQQAWIDLQVPQCGYCQSGQIMAAAALLKVTPKPNDEEINTAMSNICRCGTYPRIRDAIRVVAARSV